MSTQESGHGRHYVLPSEVERIRKQVLEARLGEAAIAKEYEELNGLIERALETGTTDPEQIDQLRRQLPPPPKPLPELARKFGIVQNPKEWWWRKFLQKEFPDIHEDEIALCMWMADHHEYARNHGIETNSPEQFIERVLSAKKRDAEMDKEFEKKEQEEKRKQKTREAYKEIIEWQKQSLVLQKADAILFDNLRASFENSTALLNREWARNLDTTFQVFAIRHDWAAAVNELVISPDELKLPYPNCMFEFFISGKHVCWGAHQVDSDGINFFGGAVKSSGAWVPIIPIHEAEMPHLFTFLRRQTAAILVTLDAEITETEPVRIPEKLNRAREKRGKYRLSDYHVIKLAAHRTRAAPAPWPASDEKRTRLRLHFRRGHWAHYQNYKTWRRWTLVGDPDLGFVDKHYSL